MKCNIDGCSYVKYMPFLRLKSKQMFDNIVGPLVASSKPEDTKINLGVNLLENKETGQLGTIPILPVRIDKMNKYFLHLMEDKNTKDCASITKIFDSSHTKRPLANQERKFFNYREKNIRIVGRCHQTKNSQTPVAVQKKQIVNQTEMPRGKVTELVKTFEARKITLQNKPRNDHNRISLNANDHNRIVTKENVPDYQNDKQQVFATMENRSLTKENVPHVNSNSAITVQKDNNRTMKSIEHNNHNLQVSSNELYNRLLDHFYKFCDDLLAKKYMEKGKFHREKTAVIKEIFVQNERVTANQKRENKENIFEEKKCNGKTFKPAPSIVQVDRQGGVMKLKRLRSGVKRTSRCAPFPNFNNPKPYRSRSLQNCINKHILRRVEPLRNRTYLFPSQTFSTVTFATDSSRSEHEDKLDDVIRIILPDDYDVSKLRNQIRAGQTKPFEAILQNTTKSCFNKGCSNAYYKIRLTPRAT